MTVRGRPSQRASGRRQGCRGRASRPGTPCRAANHAGPGRTRAPGPGSPATASRRPGARRWGRSQHSRKDSPLGGGPLRPAGGDAGATGAGGEEGDDEPLVPEEHRLVVVLGCEDAQESGRQGGRPRAARPGRQLGEVELPDELPGPVVLRPVPLRARGQARRRTGCVPRRPRSPSIATAGRAHRATKAAPGGPRRTRARSTRSAPRRLSHLRHRPTLATSGPPEGVRGRRSRGARRRTSS